MNELSKEKMMTVKEVSSILGYDESTLRKIGKELFPEIFKNGVKTYLNEMQITAIKINLGKNSELPKTELEKELLIQQAMIFQQEKIKTLQTKLIEAERRVNLLIHDQKTYTTTEIAKELNFKSATALNKLLEELGVQYKVNDTWVLSAMYSGNDFESIKQQELENGVIIYNRHWTGKGRDFILNFVEMNKF